jgi:hypothetical protein
MAVREKDLIVGTFGFDPDPLNRSLNHTMECCDRHMFKRVLGANSSFQPTYTLQNPFVAPPVNFVLSVESSTHVSDCPAPN